MSFLSKVGAWFKKVFTDITQSADKVAIAITEEIKSGLDTGVLAVIANALDALTGHVSTEVLALLKEGVPKALAIELAIQGLPANPTPADVQTFENNVLQAIGGATLLQKSALWTKLSVQILTLIQAQILTDQGQPATFAQIVTLVEESYQDYLADQADPNAN